MHMGATEWPGEGSVCAWGLYWHGWPRVWSGMEGWGLLGGMGEGQGSEAQGDGVGVGYHGGVIMCRLDLYIHVFEVT